MSVQKDVEELKELPEKAFKLGKLVFSEENLLKLGNLTVKIILIIIISMIIVRVGKALIRRFFQIQAKTRLIPSERREKTLVKLLENTLAYVIYFSAILAILGEFIDIRGLLAGAGVLGLAVGFGAQSLVKDIISGFFIIFEDQFSVGDYVEIGTSIGTVQEIGLRTTKINAAGGEVHIIPNGNITEVVNYSINNSVAIIDVRVAYDTDIVRAEKLIEQFLEGLQDKYDELVGPPQFIGVQELAAAEVVFRITAETLPTLQWAFSRKLRRELKLLFDEHGIEIPYPKLVVYDRQEGGTKNG